MIKEFKNTPFETSSGQKIIYDTEDVRVYADKWPVCDGHFLFVPKENTERAITIAMGQALRLGQTEQASGKIDGFHIGINMGKAAGQSVMWPHVHYIPRRNGDHNASQPGSVRLAHKSGKNFKYYATHPDFKDEYNKIHGKIFDDE